VIDLHEIDGKDLRKGAKGAEIVAADADVHRRALLAFLKTAQTGADMAEAKVMLHLKKRYVALILPTAIAAIYRVRNDLQLKRMRRAPQAVAYAAELERRAASERRLKYA
jgi:hypothetical protein